jgi:3-phenylpropionate/trans-cinnamate dioxygenase ferredoxin reductase subunit
MGFIGCEVAASLRQLGIDVTVVDIMQVPLQRVLGKEIGHVFEMLHQEHGVRMVFDDSVVAFRGTESVEEVVTKKGERLACDFVVVGIGTIPNTEVVEETGITIDNGIVVDEWLRTNAPGVFAAGDVANHKHPLFGPVRIEHFDNAIRMGQAAARNMMEKWEVHDDPHWFWSDQYDASLQMGGVLTEYDEMVIRGGRLQDRKFIAFFMRSNVIQATVSVNYPRDVRRSLNLIRNKVPIYDKQALKNPEVDLRTLVPAEGETDV